MSCERMGSVSANITAWSTHMCTKRWLLTQNGRKHTKLEEIQNMRESLKKKL